jgi:ankyrin repeat protein
MKKHQLDDRQSQPPQPRALIAAPELDSHAGAVNAEVRSIEQQGAFPAPHIVAQIGCLLPNADLMSYRRACRFFEWGTRADFLRRALAQTFRLVPSFYTHTKLRHQPVEVFEKLLAHLKKDSSCRDILSDTPKAVCALYALLDLSVLVKEYLGSNVENARTTTDTLAYHCYARAGLLDTFIAHMFEFHPGFSYDSENLDHKEIATQAILGGHLDFYNNLVDHFDYPDLTKNKEEALRLLSPALTSGHLKIVKIITKHLGEDVVLDFSYLIQALRSRSSILFNHLVTGKNPLCVITTKEEAAEVLTTAAEFDILPIVCYLLENPNAQEKWQCTLDTKYQNDNVFTKTFFGGSRKVFEYLLAKDPSFVNKAYVNLSPLHYCAKGGNLGMSIMLIEHCQLDPKNHTSNKEYSLHFAAESGDYNCFYQLYIRNFSDGDLPKTDEGFSPLHVAARFGRYWFLRQAFIDFNPNEFQQNSFSGETLLHFAFLSGNLYLIDFLIDECSLSLTDQDNNGNTPLHHYFTLDSSIEEQIDFVIQFVNKYDAKLFMIENNDFDTPFSLMPAQCEDLVADRIGPHQVNDY